MSLYDYARVEELVFSGTEVVGKIQGHPTEAIKLAHNICTLLYGDIRYAWRFFILTYDPPDSNHLASAGYINFRARVV